MARTFPPQLVYGVGGYSNALHDQRGASVTVYRDAALTQVETDLQVLIGGVYVAAPDGRITVDTTSRTPRLKLAGDSITQLFLKPDGADVTTPIFADPEELLTTVASTFLVSPWASGVAYVVGRLVENNGTVYRVKTAHTSGGTFDGTKFASISGAAGALTGRGFNVPAGSLSAAIAALKSHATQRVEWVGFGDSLLRGETGSVGPLYSWLGTRVRERLLAAGITNGGHGIDESIGSDTRTIPTGSGDVATFVTSKTGFTQASGFGSNTVGDTVTYSFAAEQCRLNFIRNGVSGRWSYSVNGGAAVTVNSAALDQTFTPAGAGTISQPDSLLLGAADGLTASGTNTITITNTGTPADGGSSINPIVAVGGGSIPAGTYYYVQTLTTASGETLVGPVQGPVTVNGSQAIQFALRGQSAPYTNYKLYRGTSNVVANMRLAATVPVTAGTQFYNEGAASTTASAPPTSSTLTNPNYQTIVVKIEPINSKGLVIHNGGSSGSKLTDFFDANDDGTYTNNQGSLIALGLTWGTGSNGLSLYQDSLTLPRAIDTTNDRPVTRAAARRPSLVIVAMGTNDVQNGDDGTQVPGAPTVVDGGVGIGSGLPAGTYYYKVQRLFGNGDSIKGTLSAASAGVTVVAGNQVRITAPSYGGVPVPAFNVFRATSAGGTYGLVGQIIGANASLLDNITTPGPAPQTASAQQSVQVYAAHVEAAAGHAIRLIRNAGADALICLPPLGGNYNRRLATAVRNAIHRAAVAYSCAWVDLDYPLGAENSRNSRLGITGVHLSPTAYQLQGDFVVDNIILPLYQA